ncbi:MAG: hypothetical protein IJJ84_02285, partial [Kiritimatiellae bacterium]|nr:hypothetical protein [Kiritimatiellia bacterium]
HRHRRQPKPTSNINNKTSHRQTHPSNALRYKGFATQGCLGFHEGLKTLGIEEASLFGIAHYQMSGIRDHLAKPV